MGTVFLAAVCCEAHSASGADLLIRTGRGVRVGMPPLQTAGIRTELPGFLVRGLLENCPALPASVFFRSLRFGLFCRTSGRIRSANAVSSAVGLDRIDGQVQGVRDLRAAQAAAAIRINQFFLCDGHGHVPFLVP